MFCREKISIQHHIPTPNTIIHVAQNTNIPENYIRCHAYSTFKQTNNQIKTSNRLFFLFMSFPLVPFFSHFLALEAHLFQLLAMVTFKWKQKCGISNSSNQWKNEFHSISMHTMKELYKEWIEVAKRVEMNEWSRNRVEDMYVQ